MPAYAPRTKKGKSLPKGAAAPNVGDLDLNTTSIPAVPGPGGAMSLLPYLISIYKNKEAREIATRGFQQAAETFSPAIKYAAQNLAKKYPRVAAHMNVTQRTPEEMGQIAAKMGTPGILRGVAHIQPGPVQQRVPVNVGPTNDFMGAQNTLHHEATHVAQALGNRNLNNMYDAAGRVFGYEANPYEVTARLAGEKAAYGELQDAPQNAHRLLAGLLNWSQQNSAVAHSPAYQYLQMVLKHRTGK